MLFAPYDANGNNLSQTTTSNASSDAATQNYTYNGFNQQVAASVNGSTMSYAYNAQGIRVSKTTSSTTTSYILNGGDVIGEAVDGELTVVYLRGVNLISRLGTATLFYLFNAHGDVVNLTNSAGAPTKSYDYDAFGAERNIDETDANPFRYCGEYYDTETGTYYLRARYYDPSIGRFTQEDPIRSGLNWYAYCGNNPIMFVDPSGLEMVWIREIAEKYGGTVTWDEETRTASISFGSAGTYNSQLFSSAYIGADGRMYVDDLDFLNVWGIQDSISAYSDVLGGSAVFTIFQTGHNLLGPVYYERFSVAGKEIDYSRTSDSTYDMSSISPDGRDRASIDITQVGAGESYFYTGNFQLDATSSLAYMFPFISAVTGLIPAWYSFNLSVFDIKLKITRGTTSTVYYFNSTTKEYIGKGSGFISDYANWLL